MKSTIHKEMIDQMFVGYAYHKICLNDDGKPIDYQFLEVNPAFEKVTGLYGAQIIGKKITEILPEIASDSFDWINFYGEVALTRSNKEFEQYSQVLNRWYRVQVSSPSKYHFVTFFSDITQQKDTETELKQQSETLAESIKEMNLLVQISELNQKKELKLPQILQKISELIPQAYRHPEKTAACIQHHGKTYTSENFQQSKWSLNESLQKANNQIGELSVYYIEDEKKPKGDPFLKEEQKLIKTVSWNIENIIDRFESEKKLRIGEARLRQYIDNAPEAILISDEANKFIEVNQAATTLLGIPENELLNLSLSDILSPESMEEGVAAYQGLNIGQQANIKLKLCLQKDELIPVLVSAVRLPDGKLMGFFKNMTELHQVEQEKELYYSAVQSINQPVVITDRNGKVKEVNNAFLDMYGFEKGEVIGLKPNILNPGKNVYQNLGYSDQEYETLFKGLWKSIKDPDSGTWEDVIINRKKDGSLVWVKLLINAIYDHQKNLQNFIALPIDISYSRQQENFTKIQLYQTIANLAELRDNETGIHMRRVGIFSKRLAQSLGMPQKYCDDIEIFAPMHDIGKVGILDSILLASRKLNVEEFKQMKKHTQLGYNIVKGMKELEMVSAITLNHHERWDGSGYPHGIQTEKIPLSARITSVADVYDALRSTRPYKSAWTHEAAKAEIIQNAGTQFDPELVKHFEKISDMIKTTYQELKD